MAQLSEHLSLEEFVHSDTANSKGIDNTLPESLLETATYTAVNLFEPIRALLGVPIKISSGYRCIELNTAVRGVPTSQHTKAQALDMVPKGLTVAQAFGRIEKSGLIWDQLICEHDSNNNIWIHASIVNEHNRQQVIPNLLKPNS